MPNWCTNRVRFEETYDDNGVDRGDVEGAEALLSQGFNAITPRPPELDITSGYSTRMATEFLATTDETRRNELRKSYANYPDKDLPTLDDFAARVASNLEKYGHSDWYNWSVENWGTKWDIIPDQIEESGEFLCFDTAWSPPGPILQELANRFRVTVYNAWNEEGGEAGHDVYYPEPRKHLTKETLG